MTLFCHVCELPLILEDGETFYIEGDYEEENIAAYVRHDNPETCIKLLKEEVHQLHERLIRARRQS